jgi:hypothetical protein
VPSSPGLPALRSASGEGGRGYPGSASKLGPNPNGVASAVPPRPCFASFAGSLPAFSAFYFSAFAFAPARTLAAETLNLERKLSALVNQAYGLTLKGVLLRSSPGGRSNSCGKRRRCTL